MQHDELISLTVRRHASDYAAMMEEYIVLEAHESDILMRVSSQPVRWLTVEDALELAYVRRRMEEIAQAFELFVQYGTGGYSHVAVQVFASAPVLVLLMPGKALSWDHVERMQQADAGGG